jgi:hypothetical protein
MEFVGHFKTLSAYLAVTSPSLKDKVVSISCGFARISSNGQEGDEKIQIG